MDVTKIGMDARVPPDPLVVKGGCQFGYFSLASLQYLFEKSELMLHLKNRLNKEIKFVLAATNDKYM